MFSAELIRYCCVTQSCREEWSNSLTPFSTLSFTSKILATDYSEISS